MQELKRMGRRRRGSALTAAVLLAVALGFGGFGCEPRQSLPDMTVQNTNQLPTRLAEGWDGRIYVSDAQVGSVFIYSSDLQLLQELKGLGGPLGVAVSDIGLLYVGSPQLQRVSVFDVEGVLHWTIGEGVTLMPNDLALDQSRNLYVVDSLSDTVWVFNTLGTLARSIGGPGDLDGEFDFPVAITIAYRASAAAGEVYVADQKHARIQVFDLNGTFLRAYGEHADAFDPDWEGKFVRLQSLAMDDLGRIHALDSYLNVVQILDADTGAFIDSYGAFGTAPGELNLPLDIAFTSADQVVVTNSGNHRVEVIYPTP